MKYNHNKLFFDRSRKFIEETSAEEFKDYCFDALDAFAPYSKELAKSVKKNNFSDWCKYLKDDVINHACDGFSNRFPILNQNRIDCYPISVTAEKFFPKFSFCNILLIAVYGVIMSDFKTIQDIEEKRETSTTAYGVFIPDTVAAPVLVLSGKPTKIQLAACRTLRYMWGVDTIILDEGSLWELYDYLNLIMKVETITDYNEIRRIFAFFGEQVYVPINESDQSKYLPSCNRLIDGTYMRGGKIAYV